MTEEKKLWRVGERKFLPKSGTTRVKAGFPGLQLGATVERRDSTEERRRDNPAFTDGRHPDPLTLLVPGDTVVR